MLLSLTKEKKKRQHSSVLLCCKSVPMFDCTTGAAAHDSLLYMPSKTLQDDVPRQHSDDHPKTDRVSGEEEYYAITEEKRNLTFSASVFSPFLAVSIIYALMRKVRQFEYCCWLFVRNTTEGTKSHCYKYETGGNPDDKAFQSSLCSVEHVAHCIVHPSLFWANTLRYRQKKRHLVHDGGNFKDPSLLKNYLLPSRSAEQR